MKKIIVLTLVLCMLGCSLMSCNKSGDTQVKYVLYCGLNDADSGNQILTVREAQDNARQIITDKGFGYTEYVTYGAYTDNGAVKGNDTLVYVLLFVEKAEAKAIAADIKEALNLDAVLIEEVQDNYEFAK